MGADPAGVDVLVTHGPPYGTGDWCGGPVRQGCRELREAVCRVRPLLHVFGHIHEDGGFWQAEGVCFANVTTWEAERGPTVLDLDVASRRVIAVSVPHPDNRAERGPAADRPPEGGVAESTAPP
jgi:hypothetical protein